MINKLSFLLTRESEGTSQHQFTNKRRLSLLCDNLNLIRYDRFYLSLLSGYWDNYRIFSSLISCFCVTFKHVNEDLFNPRSFALLRLNWNQDMINSNCPKRLILACSMVVLSACSTTHYLPKPPNLYHTKNPYLAEKIDSRDEQGIQTEILYVTDRKPADDKDHPFGKERSESMVFGSAKITYGDGLEWDQLTQNSPEKTTSDKIKVELQSTESISQFPDTPLLFNVTPNGIVIDETQKRAYSLSTEKMKSTLRSRLEQTTQKDVILYVHGFNNSFEDSVLGLGDIWHFSGRHGVPIAYSWPSGSGNLLGYFTDRESGEFTIYHLKETLRILAATPNVNNIHIIAHSRGTDITTSALRELVIEHRAAGRNPRQSLKIENLILAAPDLDYGVVTQRLIAEKFGPAFGKITIYMNKGDSALGLSQTLMKGIRFGKLTAETQTEKEQKIFENVKNVSFINVENVGGFVGHGYFREHPGALSDIIQVITTGSEPGSSDRPLTRIRSNFWSLDKDYLREGT